MTVTELIFAKLALAEQLFVNNLFIEFHEIVVVGAGALVPTEW